MKMTKSQFKSLLRECLSELINEGAFDKKLEKLTEGKLQAAGAKPGMIYGNSSSPQIPQTTTSSDVINPRLLEAVRNVTSQTAPGKKSMFEEIMMDTAMNTLQNQIANGDGFGSNAGLGQDMPVRPEVAAQDDAVLAAMSGGNPTRWATAAFGTKKR
jgi:hypothetical protein